MITTGLGSRYEFCWMDLKTRDLPGTAAFFSAVLGWRFAVDEEDRRRATKIATVDGHRIGGVSDLANSVYPPGTPPHLAHYLAVDDIDRRVETATAYGARLVVPPFDAGDQGRTATLTDPTGAAFSLWQPHRFTGWEFPPHAAGAPYRMLLACEQPDLARHFYREVTGTDFVHADFVEARGPVETAPQWELAVGVDDLDAVAERARDHGRGRFARSEEGGRSLLRLSSPDELTLLVVGLRNR